jgi:hypothetical protein
MNERMGNPFEVMMRELLTVIDLEALLIDPTFYGVGVPPGDGKLVAMIPGLFGSDSYLLPLNNWLCCLGYTPVRSTLSINAGCMQDARTTVQAENQSSQERCWAPNRVDRAQPRRRLGLGDRRANAGAGIASGDAGCADSQFPAIGGGRRARTSPRTNEPNLVARGQIRAPCLRSGLPLPGLRVRLRE